MNLSSVRHSMLCFEFYVFAALDLHILTWCSSSDVRIRDYVRHLSYNALYSFPLILSSSYYIESPLFFSWICCVSLISLVYKPNGGESTFFIFLFLLISPFVPSFVSFSCSDYIPRLDHYLYCLKTFLINIVS